MITLDGSHGEGGGQILRTALALSMITQKPFKIKKIRSNRPKPGLKAQHLTGINALCDISDSKVVGAEIGSDSLEFYPKPVSKRTATIDVGTAGPITLVLQTVLPPLMFIKKKSRIDIIGGTDVKWSPSIDYFSQVIIPQLKRFAEINLRLEDRGFYPKGMGKAKLTISPKARLEDEVTIDLTRQGDLIKISGVSHAHKEIHYANVSERQARAAKLALTNLNAPILINTEYADTKSIGSGITLWALFGDDGEADLDNPVIIGSDNLGSKGKKAEIVGEEAAKKLIKEVKAGSAVDLHSADILVPFLGLFGGKIKTSEITDHIRSNIYVTEKFLDVKFKIDLKDKIIEAK